MWGNLPISFLDLILTGFSLHAEQIVEFCFCYHIVRISGTRSETSLTLVGLSDLEGANR